MTTPSHQRRESTTATTHQRHNNEPGALFTSQQQRNSMLPMNLFTSSVPSLSSSSAIGPFEVTLRIDPRSETATVLTPLPEGIRMSTGLLSSHEGEEGKSIEHLQLATSVAQQRLLSSVDADEVQSLREAPVPPTLEKHFCSHCGFVTLLPSVEVQRLLAKKQGKANRDAALRNFPLEERVAMATHFCTRCGRRLLSENGGNRAAQMENREGDEEKEKASSSFEGEMQIEMLRFELQNCQRQKTASEEEVKTRDQQLETLKADLERLHSIHEAEIQSWKSKLEHSLTQHEEALIQLSKLESELQQQRVQQKPTPGTSTPTSRRASIVKGVTAEDSNNVLTSPMTAHLLREREEELEQRLREELDPLRDEATRRAWTALMEECRTTNALSNPFSMSF